VTVSTLNVRAAIREQLQSFGSHPVSTLNSCVSDTDDTFKIGKLLLQKPQWLNLYAGFNLTPLLV